MERVIGVDRYYDNSCYMNSGLQLLFHCPDLIIYILKLLETDDEDQLPDDAIVLRFMKLVAKYKLIRITKGITSISKRNFYRSFIRKHMNFGYQTQEDAQEFFIQFVDRMHEAFDGKISLRKFMSRNRNRSISKLYKKNPKLFPKVMSDSIISRIFSFSLISTLSCPCGHVSHNIEFNNNCLSVAFPHPRTSSKETKERSDETVSKIEEENEKSVPLQRKVKKSKKKNLKSPIEQEEEEEENEGEEEQEDEKVVKPKNDESDSDDEEDEEYGWLDYIASPFGAIFSTLYSAMSYLTIFPPMEYEIRLFGNKGCGINKCLDHFFAPEILESYKCEKCEEKGIQKKQLSLLDLSPYFIFHIKRFNYDGIGSKIADKLKYPNKQVIIDLKKYMFSHQKLHHDDEEEEEESQQKDEYQEVLYELIGVLNHYGTYSYGHYLSFIKDEKDDWWRCDDEEVEKCSKKSIWRCQGYLLMFKRFSVIRNNQEDDDLEDSEEEEDVVIKKKERQKEDVEVEVEQEIDEKEVKDEKEVEEEEKEEDV